MTVLLFPSVVWALDDLAEEHVARWHRGVDTDTQRFVQWGRSIADVQAHVREFNKARFRDELRPLGIALPDQTRTTVALIASGLGADAFDRWETIEAELDTLALSVVVLERIRILLADPDRSPSAGSGLKTDGLRSVPWLLSTRDDTGRSLTAADLNQHLDQLLRGLLLADRSPDIDRRSVFDAPAVPGAVRLFAFPALDPNTVLDDVASLLVGAVVFDASERRSERPEPPAETFRKSRQAVRAFLEGQQRADDVLRTILGPQGLGAWTADQLMSDGAGLLRETLNRLSQPLVTEPAATPSQPWWRRALDLMRSMFGLPPASPSPPSRGDIPSAELDYVHGRLQLAATLIEDVRRSSGALRPGCTLPADRIAEWKTELHSAITARLQSLSQHGSLLAQADSLGVLKMLNARARVYAAAEFKAQATAWDITTPDLRERVRQLSEGVPLRFAGRILAETPSVYAIAASADAPHFLPGMTSRPYWRAAGLVFFGASVPVQARQLHW